MKLELYTQADIVYMKVYNACVHDTSIQNISSCILAYKIGCLHFIYIKNYNFAVSMFAKAEVGYSLTYGNENEMTVKIRHYHKEAVIKQKERLRK